MAHLLNWRHNPEPLNIQFWLAFIISPATVATTAMGISMIRSRRVDSTTYYETLPALAHECGDIWRNLPAFGMLGTQPCCGIVITPACDLSWQKSDTLTYLPIIPVRSYFSTDAALPAILDKLLTALKMIPWDTTVDWTGAAYVVPPEEEIARLEAELGKFRSAGQHSAKVITSINRVLAGITMLRQVRETETIAIRPETLATLFGAEWPKLKDKIIRNNYSSALHFLPSDRQNSVFSAVNSHSVALFRYPITIPVKILNHAQESTDGAWPANLGTTSLAPALRSAFGGARPIKLAALRPAFLSDLLTRFSALYNRVGSPDFSTQTITTYAEEVDV